MIPNEQLDKWERLAEAATPGPWEYDDGIDVQCDFPSTFPYQEKNREAAVRSLADQASNHAHVVLANHAPVVLDDDMTDADAAFIASARTAVPALIAEVRRLLDAHEDIASALGYHPDTETMTLLLAIEDVRREARGYADLNRDLFDVRREVDRLRAALAAKWTRPHRV